MPSPLAAALLTALLCMLAGEQALASADEPTAQSAAPCTGVDDCLQRLSDPPEDAPELTRLVEHIAKMGDSAAPDLVALLGSADRDTANRAARTLSAMESIDPALLPDIIAALDLELDVLPAALVRIGTSEAAAEAVRRLFDASASESGDERWAFLVSRFGAQVIPPLMASLDCESACALQRSRQIAAVLGHMNEPTRAAAVPAVQRALEEHASDRERLLGAIVLVTAIGRPAIALESNLMGLRGALPEYPWAISEALQAIGSEFAAVGLSDALDSTPSSEQLRELAALGPAAAYAEPSVIRVLANPDPELQTAAARALGFMGSNAAVRPLITAMQKRGFPVLNAVAAESLGRLGAADASPALKQISARHWHPRVRQAAQQALAHVASGEPYVAERDAGNFAFDFFEFHRPRTRMPICEQPAIARRPESASTKRDSDTHVAWLSQQAYSLAMFEPDGADAESAPGRADYLMGPNTPQVALRVAAGWLLGANLGEWGGELVYAADDGRKQRVLDGNIEDIYNLGGQVIALGGVAHMIINEGAVHRLRLSAAGEWSAEPWLQLPGAPESSWPVETGEILVNTYGGGTVLIAADGSMRMAPCLDPPPVEDTPTP